MKAVIDRTARKDYYPDAAKNETLVATYPQLYCPRCGSYEIGLRRLIDEQILWGCRDCLADFTLAFPREKRF